MVLVLICLVRVSEGWMSMYRYNSPPPTHLEKILEIKQVPNVGLVKINGSFWMHNDNCRFRMSMKVNDEFPFTYGTEVALGVPLVSTDRQYRLVVSLESR